MEASQFLVQWEEHPSHLATRLGYLLEHQSLVDVTLMCNTHTLKVHRAVLAACSPYFERQLGNHPLIVLKDMKFSVLKSLVEFMYCGETSVSEENLTPLLEAAKFFEVKGLSAMTKESVCAPSTPLGAKTFNGASVTAPSGAFIGSTTPRSTVGLGGGASSSGMSRGRGRGRGRPPLNPTTKVGSPTESAQILLSLSNTTDPLAPVPSSALPQSSSSIHQHQNLYKNSHSQPTNKTPNSVSGENKLGPSKFGPYEPRRRGRKRGAVNSAFRDRLLREQDTHKVLENLKRDLTDDNETSSPLLSSLLSGKPPSSVSVGLDKTPGSSTGGSSDYVATKLLKEIGLPSNVPLLMDSGDGKLVTLTEEVLKSVGFDPEGQIHVQGPSLSDAKYKKPNNFLMTSKPVNRQLSIGGRMDSLIKQEHLDLSKVKKEMSESEPNDDELIQKLRTGAACEAQNDPDAVVLYAVSDDKNVEQKFVLSAKEVETLKMLNAQLDKHKKELRDLQRQQESHMQQDDSGCVADGNGGEDKCDSLGSTGSDSTTSRIAVLKLKINEVKSLLLQMMNIAQGIKPRNNGRPTLDAFHMVTEPEMVDVGDSVDLQLSDKPRIVYEFVDNNGDKIDGYQLRNPVVPDKKENNKDEFMGLFEMVCDSGENPVEDDVSPLLSESGRVVHGNSAEPSPSGDHHHSSATFHVLEDDDVHDGAGETISYEIDGMMNDEGHNIVIEGDGDTEVGGDVKDAEEDGTSSDFKYIMNVVYDSDHVIYDAANLPSAAQEDDTGEYIVYSEEDSSRHHVDDSHHPEDSDCKNDVLTGVQHNDLAGEVDFVELDDDRSTDETQLMRRENSPPVKKPRLQVDPL